MEEGTTREGNNIDSQNNNNNNYVHVPRGGPLQIPDLISPLVGVHSLQSPTVQLLRELNNLVADTDYDSHISTDDLKIFSDLELVNMALDDTSTLLTPHITTEEEEENENNKRKKTKKDRRSCSDERYMEKVEEFAKIRKKRDEDKAAARLHSFNGSKTEGDDERDDRCLDHTKLLNSAFSESKAKPSKTGRCGPISPGDDVLLRIEIYHHKKSRFKTQEFMVLARQTLTELRDNIYCLTDEAMRRAEEYDSSSYFLIEDTFCVDMRDRNSIDYTEPIFEWLNNCKGEALEKWEVIVTGDVGGKKMGVFGDDGGMTMSRLPVFNKCEMQKTCFSDLRFRLGVGYMYVHQGRCRHTFVIRDMRMVNGEDVQRRELYPLLTYCQKLRAHKCSVCKIYMATKVTVDDKWARENPCYFCDTCYFLLHYAHDGSLLYTDFSVYDYLHEE